MVDVAAVGCFASLAEATRYRPRAFLRRGFCRVDDALRWASTSTSSSIYCAQSVLGVDPYLGVGSISDSLSLDDNYPGREKRITADSRPRRRRGLRGRARKKLKLIKDQRRVEALTGRVEELEKQVCLLEDALSLI